MATVNIFKALLFATANVMFLSGVECYEYKDLIAMNATCYPKDTCRIGGKGPRLDDPLDWKARNCFCDDLCAEYGDCCLDANAYVPEEQTKNRDKYECIKLKQFGHLYMKGKCKAGWEDKYVEDRCISSSPLDHDPIAEMPVTSLNSYITYKNYFCAICNNDTSAYEIWQLRLECPSLKVYQKLYKNLTLEYVTSNLVYKEKNWGLYLPGDSEEDFHTCSVYPSMPQTVPHMIRRCKAMVKNCSSDWEDDSIRELCHSYTAVRYKFDQAYRNIHCAICNNFDVSHMFCISQSFVRFLDFGNDFNNQSFALLLDFSDRGGSNIVGSTSICNLGEVYDPFFKKCRSVICGRSNQEYRFGRCIDMETPQSKASSEAPSVSSVTPPASSVTPPASSVTPPASSVTPPASSVTPPASSANETNKLSSLLDGRDGITETPESESTNTNQTEEIFTTNQPEVNNTKSLTDLSGNVTVPAQTYPCERFLLPKEEYQMDDNGTVLVDKYEKIYQIGEYEQSDDGILVCIIQSNTQKFSRIMSLVTIGGLGLSCLCLLLHLIAFLIVPELRNLSGKNLASLCLVLLGAFSTFILSIYGGPGKNECFILAAFMYYFFLSSFCWVNVMAYDVWRTLSLATTELRVSSGGQNCKFMIYTIYGLLFPALAMASVVVLDIIRPEFLPEQFHPALGEYWCWFGHRKALLVFFAAPLMTIMVLNIILFILSARIIANTMESTAKMTSCAPYQSQFKLYMRLALLMGLTWISGIVAGYLQVEAIWYVFVLLNTLQGFFIFVAFTCTRKVWQSLGCLCCKRSQWNASSWSDRSPSSKQGLQSTNSNVSNLSSSHLATNAQISTH